MGDGLAKEGVSFMFVSFDVYYCLVVFFLLVCSLVICSHLG